MLQGNSLCEEFHLEEVKFSYGEDFVDLDSGATVFSPLVIMTQRCQKLPLYLNQ